MDSREKILEWARRKGPNTTYYGKDPLRMAIKLKDSDLVLELLEMGARVEKWHAENSYLFFRSSDPSRERLLRVFKVLIERLTEQIEEDTNWKKNFHYDLYLINQLVKHCPEEEFFLLLKPLAMALVRAIAERRVERAREWLQSIVVAAINISFSALQTLKEWGVRFSELPKSGPGIIGYVIRSEEDKEKRLEMLRFLLEEGTPIEEDNDSSYSPLWSAVRSDDLEALKLLLQYGADPFQKDQFGCYLTSCCKSPEVLRVLVDLGVPIDLRGQNVSLICEFDPVLTVETLKKEILRLNDYEAGKLISHVFSAMVVKSKVSKDELLTRLEMFEALQPRWGYVEIEGFQGDLEKLLLLDDWAQSQGLELGRGWMKLAVKLGAGKEEIRKLMAGKTERDLAQEAQKAWLDFNPLRAKDPALMNLLIWLSHEAGGAFVDVNNLKSLQDYLEAGGNPNAKVDDWENTLLHKAVIGRKINAVQLLLENGANPELRNFEGFPPLHFLILTERLGPYRELNEDAELIFSLLVSYGANPEAKNEKGESLKDLIHRAIEFSKQTAFRKGSESRKQMRGFLKKMSNPKAFGQRKLLEVLSGI